MSAADSALFEEIVFDETDEAEESGLDGNRRPIHTEKNDTRISALYEDWKDGRLILRPDFQRGWVWDPKKASRLIESVLLDIPLPTVYLFEERDDRQNVIDGQQRLTSFFSFIDGELPGEKHFKLSGLNALKELNGETFKSLDKNLQQKIKTYSLRTILFKKESDPDLQFEIFERLNTASVALNEQELRNCIFRGKLNSLLHELAEDADFRKLLGLKAPEKRMRDVELVLRFSAFLLRSHINYKPPIKKFLNDFMSEERDISPAKEAAIRKGFKTAVDVITSMFGEHAFRRYYSGDSQKNPNGRWEPKKFNVSLYDILMDTFARMDKNQSYRHMDRLGEALIDVMSREQRFIDSIELSTSSMKAINARFSIWRDAVQSVVGDDRVQDRCFTQTLRQQLYENDDSCAICKNKIVRVDDAAMDHIVQYWQGGMTIPENARLTHRYCNNARARKEAV
ncbi:MAG: DUF262 domain-containing protein [Flavobacteriales bacterium]